jgi:hypothetical protein
MKRASKNIEATGSKNDSNVFDIHKKVNKSQALIVLENIPLSQFL